MNYRGKEIPPTKFVWLDGKLVEWEKATVHFLTHSLHYGGGVFEGIRCYNTAKGPAIFRLKEHIARLFNSAKIMQLQIPFSLQEMSNACIELVRKNGLKSCYLRPLVFFGYGKMGLGTLGLKASAGIAAWEWEPYLGKEGEEKGVRVKISSFSSHHPNMLLTKSKTAANYASFGLAKNEALLAGYDEALMLDPQGFVCEGSAENIFIVRNGFLITPPLENILEGITRDSVLQLAKDLKIPVREENFSRDYLYTADEAFLSGTAAEIVPITTVDDRIMGDGKPGPVTKKLQKKFSETVQGKDKKYFKWLEFVK